MHIKCSLYLCFYLSLFHLYLIRSTQNKCVSNFGSANQNKRLKLFGTSKLIIQRVATYFCKVLNFSANAS